MEHFANKGNNKINYCALVRLLSAWRNTCLINVSSLFFQRTYLFILKVKLAMVYFRLSKLLVAFCIFQVTKIQYCKQFFSSIRFVTLYFKALNKIETACLPLSVTHIAAIRYSNGLSSTIIWSIGDNLIPIPSFDHARYKPVIRRKRRLINGQYTLDRTRITPLAFDIRKLTRSTIELDDHDDDDNDIDACAHFKKKLIGYVGRAWNAHRDARLQI